MISRPAPRGVHTPQTTPAATLYAICNATVGNVNPKRIRTPLRAAAGSQPTCNIILSWPRGPLSLHKASPLNPLVGYPIYQLQQTMSTTGRPSSRHEDATPPDSPAIRSGPETSWRVYIYSKQCFLLYLTKVVFHSTAEDYFSIGLGLIGNLRFVGGLLFSLISLAYFTSIFVVVSRELRVYRTGTGRAVTLPTMARNFIYALDASVCERKQRQAFERE